MQQNRNKNGEHVIKVRLKISRIELARAKSDFQRGLNYTLLRGSWSLKYSTSFRNPGYGNIICFGQHNQKFTNEVLPQIYCPLSNQSQTVSQRKTTVNNKLATTSPAVR